MPTLTLVNLTGFSRGVRVDEVGINIREQKTVIEPEFIEILPDRQNMARGKAVAAMKATVDISGEINTTLAGVMLATAVAPFTPANSRAYFGAPTTGLYLTRAEVTEGRDSWLDLVANFDSHAGIA